MFCSKCGNQIAEGAAFCAKCGAAQQSTSVLVENTPYQKTEEITTNTMAIIGFVVSLISLLINFWGIVGIAATVLSVLGYIGCKQKNQKGKGLALAGIIIGASSVIWGTISLIVLSGMF